MNLPPNWSWVKLGEAGQIITGTTPPKNNLKNYGDYVPLYKPSDLNVGTNILTAKDNLSKIGIENARLLPEGSILVTCIGATIGKTGLIKKAGASNQQINAIVPGPNFISEFIYYFCISENFQKQIHKNASSTTLPILNKSKFEKLTIPLPPLPEQKKIVEKIEELFSGLDSGVASLKKAKEQIRLYRQSVLSAAFCGKLVKDGKRETKDGELPEGWKWVKLGEIIKVSSGKGLTSEKMLSNGKYSVYGGNGISGYYNEFLFEEPRLIIGRVGAKCGVIHITKPKSWVTDNALIVDFTSKNVEMKFLYHCLDYHNLNKLSVSTAQPVISGAKIYPYEIMLPPLTQQTQIVAEIEKRFSEADNLEKAIDESLTKSETLRQSILKQAFEGKLV